MSCERFREAITDHASGALIDEAAGRHLAACDPCARAFEQRQQLLAEVDDELRGALAIVASPDFSARVSRAVRTVPPSPKPVLHWWMAAAAAVALVAAGVFLTFTAGRTVRPEQSAAAPRTSSQPPSVSTPAPRAAAASPVAAEHVAPTGRAHPARQVVNRPRGLEVIVSPAQARAIARLKELASRGVQESEAPESMLVKPPVAELVIQPLRVADLSVPDLDAGSGSGVEQQNPVKESFR
jgi:hypothetical protein